MVDAGIKCVSGETLGFYRGNCRGISTSQQEAGKNNVSVIVVGENNCCFFSLEQNMLVKNPTYCDPERE